VLAAAYLVRGVGDVEQSWVTWLSRLGWAEKTRSFGDPRWWPLVLPLAASVTGAGVALVVAARRDVGSSWGRAGRGPTSATPGLLRPAARSLRTSRGAMVTWSAGAALVAGMFGALSRQAAEALQGSPEARAALGGTGLSGADVLVRLNLVLLSLLVAAFAVQWVGGIREEETSGRLEVVLAGRVSRSRWLEAQVAALLVGALAVGVAGGLALALSTAWSLDDAAQLPRLLRGAAAQLPVALVLAGAALAVFGLRPRWQGLVWLLFAGTAAVALLGEPLGLPDWVRRLSPTEHLGSLPVGRLDAAGVVGVCAVALLLAALGWAGFRRRDVPQG
jgi:ABC-2 type transport system permease protein